MLIWNMQRFSQLAEEIQWYNIPLFIPRSKVQILAVITVRGKGEESTTYV
jgi:hypothetical protein